MHVEPFELERLQSVYENLVEVNLSDSGVHPFDLKALLDAQEIERLTNVELGYGWTNGDPALRAAIANLYANRSADEVIVTNGSAEANFLVVTTLLEPGDEFIVITPNYLQMHGWARSLGVNVLTSPLQPGSWRPDLDHLASLITPRTKLISFCNPNNPTGQVMPEADLRSLANMARRHGIWLHADEVYRGAELEGDEGPSLADLYERAIVTNGLSKAMALPGLRIGWLCGPAAEIEAAWVAKDYTSITTGALSEAIATLALQPQRRQQILARSRAWLRDNLATLQAWVDKEPRFTLTPPQAGGMAFAAYDAPINSTALSERLRKESSVLVVPGDVYGLDGHLRFGIGARPEDLTEGLARVSRMMALLD